MTDFTDLLDNYLLALGIHNQAHSLHEHDPLRFAKEFHEAVEALKIAKSDLNTYFKSLTQIPNILVQT